MLINFLMCAALVATSFSAFAQEGMTSIGDWHVDRTFPGIQFAFTKSSEEVDVGVFCLAETNGCRAYLVVEATCDKGDKYPMMVNSKLGARHLVAECQHLNSNHFLLFDEFDAMINIFQSGGVIGFAMPMRDGRFEVMRFSTVGANSAITQARTIQQQPQKNDKRLPSRESL